LASVECGTVGSTVSLDLVIGQLAAKQHGVVSRRQLLDVGAGGRAIDHRLATGRLHRIRRGIYLVGHWTPPPLAEEAAALLSCGTGAALSHWTAVEIWRLISNRPGSREIHITVPGRDPGTKPGIRLHRVRALDRRDVRKVEGLPVTAPARILLDLAGEASVREVERALAEAQTRRLVSRHDVIAALAQSESPSRDRHVEEAGGGRKCPCADPV
jgi:predicted transcriptional regulator of viral defense system